MAVYDWRRMTSGERLEALAKRRAFQRPWHSPPHLHGPGRFLISAACFEHEPHIAYSAERLDHFTQLLLDLLNAHASRLFSWCVLPNHYHAAIQVNDLDALLKALGK